MAKADIGPKIGIDGEKQFRQQLQSINEGLKTTQSEMKAVTSAFIGNEQSTEALTAENDVLDRSISSLNEKLAVQQQLLDATAKAYGEAAPQTQRLQRAVNETTAQINTANAQIGANNQQITANNSLLGKLGINLGTITQKLGLTSGATNTLTSALGSSAAAYAAIGTAVVKLIGKLNEFVGVQAEQIDAINTLAAKYHAAAEDIQVLNYAQNFLDVSTETVLGSITKLTRSMDGARDGTGAAAEAFQKLGVSVTNSDGSLRSSNAVFMETIDALGRIHNETEQDALAMEVFGKSAMDLRGVIDAGSDGLKGYAEEAHRLGLVISEEANANLQSFQDASDRASSIAGSFKTNLAALLAPLGEFFVEAGAGWLYAGNELVKWLGGFDSDSAEAAKTVRDFADANGELKESLNDVSNALSAASKDTQSYRDQFLGAFSDEQLTRMTEAQREYAAYLQRLSDYYGEIGIPDGQGYHMSYNDFAGRYFPNDPSYASPRIDVTLEIDGQKLAQTTLDDFENEANRRGPSAFGASSSTFSSSR